MIRDLRKIITSADVILICFLLIISVFILVLIKDDISAKQVEISYHNELLVSTPLNKDRIIELDEGIIIDPLVFPLTVSTSTSILSDSKSEYFGIGELSSVPEIIFISKGDSLDKNMYEYKDAENWIKINELLSEKGELNIFRHLKYKSLLEKYGYNQ
jgi:hypothetical protein